MSWEIETKFERQIYHWLSSLRMSDKFSARAYYLHQEAFYRGYLDQEKIRRELEKVEGHIKAVEELVAR